MLSAKTSPLNDMFHQNLRSMNEEQLATIKDNYTQMIVDRLYHKEVYRIVFDYLRSEIESATECELRDEIVDMFGEDKWDELSKPAQ